MDERKIKLFSEDFIPLMNERFQNNAALNLTVTGNSMLPFLADRRDTVILTRIKHRPKKGDIFLYVRAGGNCVLHRVKRVATEGVYFIGDAQTQLEGPVPFSALLAECHAVIRKGKTVTEKSPLWFFFQHIWILLIRLRMPILKGIGIFKANSMIV